MLAGWRHGMARGYMQKTLDPRLLMSRMTEGGEGGEGGPHLMRGLQLKGKRTGEEPGRRRHEMPPLRLKRKGWEGAGMGIGARGWGSVLNVLRGYSGLTRLGGMRRIGARFRDQRSFHFVTCLRVDTLHVKPNGPPRRRV